MVVCGIEGLREKYLLVFRNNQMKRGYSELKSLKLLLGEKNHIYQLLQQVLMLPMKLRESSVQILFVSSLKNGAPNNPILSKYLLC